jgi:hypothetical protein
VAKKKTRNKVAKKKSGDRGLKRIEEFCSGGGVQGVIVLGEYTNSSKRNPKHHYSLKSIWLWGVIRQLSAYNLIYDSSYPSIRVEVNGPYIIGKEVPCLKAEIPLQGLPFILRPRALFTRVPLKYSGDNTWLPPLDSTKNFL